MFGLGVKAKPKRKYSKPQQSRVDKIISILDEANRKDKEEKSKPKRKYKKKKSFGIGW